MFGSQARPGMRGNLGSLSGHVFGDVNIDDHRTGATTTWAPTKTESVAVAPPATPVTTGISTTTKLVAGVAVAGLAYWYFVARKRKG